MEGCRTVRLRNARIQHSAKVIIVIIVKQFRECFDATISPWRKLKWIHMNDSKMFNNGHEVQGHSQLIITKVSSINLVPIHVTSRCCLSLIHAYTQWPSTYSALQTPTKAVDADWLVTACHVLIPSIVANQIIIHCEIKYLNTSQIAFRSYNGMTIWSNIFS